MTEKHMEELKRETRDRLVEGEKLGTGEVLGCLKQKRGRLWQWVRGAGEETA